MCVWSQATLLFHICGAKHNQNKLLPFLSQKAPRERISGIETGNLHLKYQHQTGLLSMDLQNPLHGIIGTLHLYLKP